MFTISQDNYLNNFVIYIKWQPSVITDNSTQTNIDIRAFDPQQPENYIQVHGTLSLGH